MSEIKLRAGIRIGELSLHLDKSADGANPKATLPADGKSKADTLKSAGISTSTANRFEELAGIKRSRTGRFWTRLNGGSPSPFD